MTDVVGEDAAERGERTLRAELALKTLGSDPGPRERLRRVLEQALAFGGATLAAVYAPGQDGDELCLLASAGVPRTLYGLRDSYPLGGSAPVVDAHRAGRPVWLTPEKLSRCPDARRLPSQQFSLAVLPLRDGGCLAAVTEDPGGFGPEDRQCLTLVADAAARATPAPSDGGAGPREPAASAFSLAMDSG
ncbi:GAF domain-containing protein, partial [Streptomyces sp. NPDC059786]